MLEEIAQILFASANKPINLMKHKLKSSVRSGNKMPQSTTGKTADSIRAEFPRLVANTIEWVFKSNDAAVRLNNGGSLKTKGSSDVPFSGIGGGGQSAYIGGLIKWAMQKYGLDEANAKRMAFKVAGAAKDRGRTVKSPGWLDDAKRELEDMINKEISAAITVAINKKISVSLK
ncbi:MAG: hypothetical protein GOVbin5978_45 [Prokaryotic dsDNA virus sp.]|nr:MAG: hypothetical protein GOVbin5978_45 [Prokaryotic dsDNA virus sp.]|tara:strand:- start:13593 stop:14114 length:522 start_codon:yes stop_codon:yes gene_type:complete